MSGPRYQSTLTTAMSAALLLTLLFANANTVAADLGGIPSERPDIATLVNRIVEAQSNSRARAKPYSVTREYKVFGSDEYRRRTELIAQVNFLPPNVQSYGIANSTDVLGEKVRHRILAHEVDATRDPT